MFAEVNKDRSVQKLDFQKSDPSRVCVVGGMFTVSKHTDCDLRPLLRHS